MARQNHGPLSRAKGKIGGVVYQQYEGMQISREYQPVVKNPQSEKQVTNRADFKLASQTVALFKEVINARLGKLSIYTRTRRGAALEALKRIATVGNDNQRAIDFNQAISSINAKSLTEYSAPNVVASGNSINVTAPADGAILGVIVGFDTNQQVVGRKVVSSVSGGGAVEFAVPADFTIYKSMFLYTIPTEEEGRAIYSNIEDPDAALVLDIARLVAAGDLGISDIAGLAGVRS